MSSEIKRIEDRLIRMETKQDKHSQKSMDEHMKTNVHLTKINGEIKSHANRLDNHDKYIEESSSKIWEIGKGIFFAVIGGIITIGGVLVLGVLQ